MSREHRIAEIRTLLEDLEEVVPQVDMALFVDDLTEVRLAWVQARLIEARDILDGVRVSVGAATREEA